MSRTHSFIKAAAAVSVLGTLASSAQAALTVDLRFTDATKAKVIAANDLTPITIQAWAVAKGAAGNAQPDGLQSIIAAIESQVTSAGFTGGISSAAIATGWGGSGSSAGSSSNLSADSIGDWGNATNTPLTVTAAMGYFRGRTTKSTNNQVDWSDADSPAGSVHNTITDGVEFLVGTFIFTPTAAPAGAQVYYNPAAPAGGTSATAGWWEDTADKTAGSPTNPRSNSTGTYGPFTPLAFSNSSVSITVTPEPTSIGFLGLGALGLIRRRRA